MGICSKVLFRMTCNAPVQAVTVPISASVLCAADVICEESTVSGGVDVLEGNAAVFDGGAAEILGERALITGMGAIIRGMGAVITGTGPKVVCSKMAGAYRAARSSILGRFRYRSSIEL